ncbi:MAG: hypothetical protein IT373_00480 [Polyangiaceae bacterium]|nr:hypothetical protein [Polyangiaceae bacterium]
MSHDRTERGAGDDEVGTPPPSDGGAGRRELELDDIDVKNLLRKALDPPPQRPATKRTLKAVQKRIRARSGGRFFADGWSTLRGPRVSYLVTAVLMLVLLALAWLLLAPHELR